MSKQQAFRFSVSLMVMVFLNMNMFGQDQAILFTTQKAGGNDELAMLVNGRLSLLTQHSAKDSSPDLSPDGRHVVFTSERKGWWKIWLYNLESGNIEQLTTSSSAEYAPDFSPEGDKIVFTSGRNGSPDLFIMNTDGSQIKNLTNTNASEGNAFWAADGYIYYASNESGKYQLTRIRPDGKDKEILSDGKSDDLDPVLSPDGKSLVYYSYRYDNPEVCLLDLESRKVTRLTDNPLQDIRPAWSGDGKYIVFERGNKRNDQQLYIMKADGSDQRKLTSKGYNYAPVFVENTSFLSRIKAPR